MEAIFTNGTPFVGLTKATIPNIPRIRIPKKNASTVTSILIRQDDTVLVAERPEYTDEQFAADLKKASKRLDQMVAEALEEDAKGKTLEFPA